MRSQGANSALIFKTHIHIQAYIHMYIHTYIHAYIHTYIHTYRSMSHTQILIIKKHPYHTSIHTCIRTYIQITEVCLTHKFLLSKLWNTIYWLHPNRYSKHTNFNKTWRIVEGLFTSFVCLRTFENIYCHYFCHY